MNKNDKEADLVSVIIPVYNAEQYLDRCISSVANQTYKNIEIIIVNDGSKDNSLNICKSWKEKDKRIVFINKESNTGASDSRNIGLDNAKGKYVSFVDSDDFAEQSMIEELVNNIEQTGSDISMCEINFINGTDKRASSRNYQSSMDKYTFLRKITESNKCNMLWDKLFIREIIGVNRFDVNSRIGEDEAFLCEYVDKISKVSYINKPLYNYNVSNPNSITRGDSRLYITGIKSHYAINKILENNCIEERYKLQANSVCNLVKHKSKLGKNYDYSEYEKIVKEYIDNGLLHKVKGIKNKAKVYLAYYFKGLYLMLVKFDKKF